MKDKTGKLRGSRLNGRGHRKHKSGSRGGVGHAGSWTHKKNCKWLLREVQQKQLARSKVSYVHLNKVLQFLDQKLKEATAPQTIYLPYWRIKKILMTTPMSLQEIKKGPVVRSLKPKLKGSHIVGHMSKSCKLFFQQLTSE